jgi:vacuolar-type H+-ATPase subunit F/Vma7
MEFFVIGEEEIVIGFGFAGVQGRAVSGRDEAFEAFKHATGIEGLRVLIITEEVATLLAEEVLQWQLDGRFPLLVEIPGLQGRMPGKKTLVESIREAVGLSV